MLLRLVIRRHGQRWKEYTKNSASFRGANDFDRSGMPAHDSKDSREA